MRYRRTNNKAQNFVEYTLVLGIAVLALFSMQTYFKRGIQSTIKVVADDLGPQGEPIATKFKSDPEIFAKKVDDQRKIEEATKANYYPKGNKNTYYSYSDSKYLPIENKYTYTSTSTEDTTIKNEGEGKIRRTVNKSGTSSYDKSY